MKAGHLSALIAALLAAASFAVFSQDEGDAAPPVENSVIVEEMPPPDEAIPVEEEAPPDERLPDEAQERTVIERRSGDVLTMPGRASEPPPRRVLPHHGLSMSDVERQYGNPHRRHPAVGQPPITRWDYDGFSVFFEHRTVLHSVQEDRPAEIVNRDELIQP